MALGINTNIASLNAQNQLNKSQSLSNEALQRLSSGLRINSAKDDAAGLAISTRFDAQIRGLTVATRNANDGISLAQTAEGALNEITNNLQRIRELAVQASNATNSASDREALQAEVSQLVEEVDRVATQTAFNGIKLFDGNFKQQNFQVGANVGETISISSIASARSSALGQYSGFNEKDIAVTAAPGTDSEVVIGDKTYKLGSVKGDAKDIAAALNAANISGLNATAQETKASGAAVTTGAGTPGKVSFSLNGVKIEVEVTGNASTNVNKALERINSVSAATGVKAVDNGGKIDLVAADGRNITVADFAAGSATDSTLTGLFGLTEGTTTAELDIDYKAPSGSTNEVKISGALNFTGKVEATGTALNAIDISTVAGANSALNSVDAALDTVNSARADLGALQNRFESTIANLATTVENMSASQSRILDADFAAETAKMSKAQVLQQAGISVLAQANARPQQVLSLLQ